MHVLVAGCGWLGSELARRFVARGDRVTGVRRDPDRTAALATMGVEPLAVDLAAPDAERRLPRDVDAIVACQSAGADTPEAYRAAYVDANQTLLALAGRADARLIYTGSTAVFGQRDGSEVDETTPPAPASETAEVLADAEMLVAGAARGGVRASLLRLSGLYGPGRTGIVDRVRAGRLALGPGDGAWMNFCHLHDACAFVLAGLERGHPGDVHHGTDAAPAPRREVVGWIAHRIGIAPPESPAPAAGPNRRILSARTRDALGVTLAYPSFREGLAALVPPAPGQG